MGVHTFLAETCPKTYGLAAAMAAKVVAVLAAMLAVLGSQRLRQDSAAAANLGTMVLVLVLAVLVPVIIMELLAQLLPDYFGSLGTLFTALDAINTTGWPAIVATMFGFVPLVLGVVAIGAVFGLGALLVIRARGARS